jgi:hypothetical protein
VEEVLFSTLFQAAQGRGGGATILLIAPGPAVAAKSRFSRQFDPTHAAVDDGVHVVPGIKIVFV